MNIKYLKLTNEVNKLNVEFTLYPDALGVIVDNGETYEALLSEESTRKLYEFLKGIYDEE